MRPQPIHGRLKAFTLHTTQEDLNFDISAITGVQQTRPPQHDTAQSSMHEREQPARGTGPSARLRPHDDDAIDDDDLMDMPPSHPVIKKQRTIKNVVVNAHRQATLHQQTKRNVVKYPHAPTARCAPAIFNAAVDHLTFHKRTRVQTMQCDGLLLLRAERLGSRELLKYLFDRLDPCTMVINVGKGRRIHVTPFAVKQVLGIPDSGEDLPLRTNNEAGKALSDFKALVGLQDSEDVHTSYLLKIMEDDTKYNSRMIDDDLAIRIFFVFACNKLLFPSTDNNIRAKDVYLTRDLSRLPGMNWCKAVVDEIRDVVRTWRVDKMKKVCPSISGCAIFLILLYLDNVECKYQIQHTDAPRTKYFTQDLIKMIIAADKTKDAQGKVTFGMLPLRNIADTCYLPSQSSILDAAANTSPFSAIQIPSLVVHLGGLVDGIVSSTRRSQTRLALSEFDAKSKEATSLIAKGQEMLQDAHHVVIHKVTKILLDEAHANNTEDLHHHPDDSSADHVGGINIGNTVPPAHASERSENPLSVDPQNSAATNIIAGEATPTLHTDEADNVCDEDGMLHGWSPVCSQLHTDATIGDVIPPAMNTVDAAVEALNSTGELVTTTTTCAGHPQAATADVATGEPVVPLDTNAHVPAQVQRLNDAMVTNVEPVQGTESTKVVYPKPQRLTKRPAMYISPFKGDPRRANANLFKSNVVRNKFRSSDNNLRYNLCFVISNLSYLKHILMIPILYINEVFIRKGIKDFTGREIVDSFIDEQTLSYTFMSYFVDCLRHDEMFHTDGCGGYRVFLSPQLLDYINIEDNSQWESPASLALLCRQLDDVDPTKVKLFLFPVIEDFHYIVYCINFIHDRIDILDSSPEDHRLYHEALGDRIIPRLNLLFQLETDYRLKHLARFKRPIIDIPKHGNPNDSGFFAIKFMELWNGQSFHGPIHKECVSNYKSQILYYGLYHPLNDITKLPFGLEAHRPRSISTLLEK